MSEVLNKQSKAQFNAEMEQAWQEMLNGGGIPLEDFLEEFEKEFNNEVQNKNDVVGSGESA